MGKLLHKKPLLMMNIHETAFIVVNILLVIIAKC
jgi:hypothetical protein